MSTHVHSCSLTLTHVHSHTHRFSRVHSHLLSCTLIYTHICSCTHMFTDVYSCTLTVTNIHSCTLIYSCSPMCNLVHLCTLITLMYLQVHWHSLVMILLCHCISINRSFHVNLVHWCTDEVPQNCGLKSCHIWRSKGTPTNNINYSCHIKLQNLFNQSYMIHFVPNHTINY